MTRTTRAIVIALATLALCATASAATPSWGRAANVTLPAGGLTVTSGYLPGLSCPGARSCVAVGDYSDWKNTTRGLIASEVAGVWRKPVAIVAPSGASGTAAVTPSAVACSSVGNCLVVGFYDDANGDAQGFLDAEVAGAWRGAQRAPLPANAEGLGQGAALRAVSCPSRHACVAVGSYLAVGPVPALEGFAVSGSSGSWSAAEVAPANANANPDVSLGQVACASATSCAAAGSYLDANGSSRGLLATLTGTLWHESELAAPPDASAYAGASISGVACPGVGACVAAGVFETAAGEREAFVVASHAGSWGTATTIAMPTGASSNPLAFFYGFADLACHGVGNCALGGQYRDAAGLIQGFLADEVGGTWRAATELALPAGATQAGHNGGVVALTCPAVGRCRAGAAYVDAAGRYQAYVVGEAAHRWTSATTIALPKGATQVGVDGGVYGLVCASVASCTATGSYLDSSSSYEGFAATLG
ncbi:MAG: hypothetical protein ACRDV0_09070 [Acidimicrobiales bacterium]